MFRIGIDLDNTIAWYDQTFYRVALSMGLVNTDTPCFKTNIKSHILSLPEGEISWQRLQGQVYGKHMSSAAIFPGFLEFILLSRLRKNEVFIVSHKSEFGHFDESLVPLREKAMLWMQSNHFFDKDSFSFDVRDVFFESTREQKVCRIKELRCTHFIDDLSEVFEEPMFPSKTKKILFKTIPDSFEDKKVTEARSWRDITQKMYSPWTEEEVCQVIQSRFPKLGIEHSELRKGRGNSRVYKLSSESNGAFALKVYPDRQQDPRPRLETEFSASVLMSAKGYPVAEPIACDKDLGWGIYRWISDVPISMPDDEFMVEATEFIIRLLGDSRTNKSFDTFDQASEACLSGAEIVNQIYRRLKMLMAIDSKELLSFLSLELLPFMELITKKARSEIGSLFDSDLSRSDQMLSPSDFGSHNALRSGGERTTFIDFEYFGWDDPVKLVSDVYWHPGMRLNPPQRELWISKCLDLFSRDASFSKRLNAYLPLYGIRWCLIILNVYLRSGAENRLHANPQKDFDLTKTCIEQLSKSRMLLQEVMEIGHV